MKYPFFLQHDQMDCGPTCIRIIAKVYGKNISSERVLELTALGRDGSSFKSLSTASEQLGFQPLGVKASYEQLANEMLLPCIAHWNGLHFVVIHKVDKKSVLVADPSYGLIKYNKQEFSEGWIGKNQLAEGETTGAILLLEPTDKLNHKSHHEEAAAQDGFSFLFKYLAQHKKLFLQLFLGLLLGSALQVMFPFVTQSIVDIGIHDNDINFIYLMLFAQLSLFLGRMFLDVVRSWILLHVSTQINVSLISNFFIKMMALPISYFDVKMTGDLLQRIGDHRKIEKLLTSTSLNILFSAINLILFGIVLLVYNTSIFLIFVGGSVLYFVWITLFLKKRREFDYKRFSKLSREQSKVIELINGMQEIKLNNAEREKRWEWELLQAQLFKLELKSHSLEQYQVSGANVINELKNILVTFFAAKLVLDGELTLGMMLSITYIIGQLNGPLLQIIDFMVSTQDAKLALERLSEIHNKKNEEMATCNKVTSVDHNDGIVISDLTFRYPGMETNTVERLNLKVEANSVTAIVGPSGCGKTTLMKLLLQFYKSSKGEITVGGTNLNDIAPSAWRAVCGVVMQEGFIFNDTIIKNICVDGEVDHQRLAMAVETANLTEFIENLPLQYETVIGQEGVGISTGQKQRILIARAIYKDPKFIFFDEATSALDATNERGIMEKFDRFFQGRTVVVIAHRLSTVMKADKIIVFDKGKVIEEGTHGELLLKGGAYYALVANQLNLEAIAEDGL